MKINSPTFEAMPIFRTIMHALLIMVALFVISGCTSNIREDNPLVSAATTGNVAQVTHLLGQGANPNVSLSDGTTPLFMASQQGHTIIVQLLLNSRSDVNAKSYSGSYPLIIAATAGHKDIVEMLLKSGATVDVQRADGVTALYMAAQSGYLDIVKQLLQAGADVNKPAYKSATPLYIAAQIGHHTLVDLLAKNGADVNVTIPNGSTPLIAAASKGHVSVTRILLANGADTQYKNHDGLTALQVAQREGHPDLVAMLRKSETMVKAKTPEAVASSVQHQTQVTGSPNNVGDNQNQATQPGQDVSTATLPIPEASSVAVESSAAGAVVSTAEVPAVAPVVSKSAAPQSMQQKNTTSAVDVQASQPKLQGGETTAIKQIVSSPAIETAVAVGDILSTAPGPKEVTSTPSTTETSTLQGQPANTVQPEQLVTATEGDVVGATPPLPSSEKMLDDARMSDIGAAAGSSGQETEIQAKVVNQVKTDSVQETQPVMKTGTVAPDSEIRVARIAEPGTVRPVENQTGNKAKEQYISALTMIRNKQYSQAVVALKAFLATYPDMSLTPGALYWSGAAYYSQRDYKQAAIEFLSLYKKYPSNEKAPDGLLHLAKSLAALNRKDAACSTLARLRSEYPGAWPRVEKDANDTAKQVACP